jgi:uncharacterized protein YndB with AHSA1/START domain
MNTVFTTAVQIRANPAAVWQAITSPVHMLRWMGDEDMNLDIKTDWMPGSTIVISGRHHLPFENKGRVLKHIPEQNLSYTHLSSLSRLADVPENYTQIAFSLEAEESGTILRLHITNFPTVSIEQHLVFYWRTTIIKIKQYTEQYLSGIS